MTFSLPLEAPTLEALMQTLVHFLWQGLLLAVGAACLLQVASLRTAKARYAFYCGLLALLAASPVVTFSILSAGSASSAAVVVENDANVLSPLAAEVASGARVDRRQRTSFHGEGQAATVAAWLDRHRSLIVGSWLAGVMLFGARLLFAAVGVRSLGRKCLPPPGHVTLAVERLARQMAFRAAPRFFIVERLSQAAAVGIFKPMVVLPAAWLCELPPNVLEAVLAHELAHLR